MSTSKETPQQTVTHQEFSKSINPQILKAVQEIDALKGTNQITRAFKVQAKEIKKGNAKLDENKNPVIKPDGTPDMWSDRFVIETTSEHGKISIKVNEEQFNQIQVGQWYMAVGHVEIYTPYEGMPKEIIKYDDFQLLFGVQA